MKYILLIITGCFSLFLNGYSQVSIEELIAYYPFNGNANDESGNGNNGTVYGATLTTDRFGNENSAYAFDGVDDFIEVIPISNVSDIGDFSIALWAYCYEWEIQTPGDNTYDRQYIFDGASNTNTAVNDFYRDGFRIMYDYSTSYEEKLHNTIIYDYSNLSNNYLATNTTLNLVGNWHFIIFSREGNQDITFFDGVQIESTYSINVKKSDVLNMQHPWYIGSGFGNNPNYPNTRNYNFNGKIDDIRIYRRRLDSIEVSELYNSQHTEPQTLNIEGINNVCQGQQNVTFNASQINGAISYTWNYSGDGISLSKNDNNLTVNFSKIATSGYLSVSAELANGTTISSEDFYVSINSLPSAAGEITGDNEACLGESGLNYHTSKIDSATNYIWEYNGTGATIFGNSNDVTVNFDENATGGLLNVFGVNNCGVGESSSILINVENCSQVSTNLKIPNSFTPNGDGINEMFVIGGLTESSTLQIFNRLGKMLYKSSNYQNNWNGTDLDGNDLSTGTYWYVLNIQGIPTSFKGFVYLKR